MKIAEFKNRAGEMETTIVRLTREIERRGGGEENLPNTFVASIVAYEPQYDFIVLDKGSLQQAVKNGELIVYRGKEFVCRAKITRVLANKCIAEIQAGSRAGSPIVGDKVIPFK